MADTRPDAHHDLQELLDRLHRDYENDIENLTDAATDDIETAVQRGDLDIKELVRDYTDEASQLADDYYHKIRQAWQEHTGTDYDTMLDTSLIDSDRVLWETRHGFNDTAYMGTRYIDVKNGRTRAGLTMDDLWPSMSNPDDAQQFIADMIANATRMQTMRNMRNDPTKPRWARRARRSVPSWSPASTPHGPTATWHWHASA